MGPACTELADQIEPADELLLICDTKTDPVAGRETPPNIEVLTAGDPTGCSRKANALAHGMERANHDCFVWTDDDFTRPPDWLDRLVDVRTNTDQRLPFRTSSAMGGVGGWLNRL